MPAVSRWMIRLSLIYFIAGILAGAFLLIHKAYPLHPTAWLLLPLHIEVTIFGWIIQYTLGTAYWMLPRYLKGKPRGSRLMSWVMVLCLNLGIVFIIIDPLEWVSIQLRFTGRVLEVIAVLLFIILHWNRIVTYRNR